MEEAFWNMFHLLKPGEAAVLFVVKGLIHDWLKEILKPKWKDAYKGINVEDFHENGEAEYKKMVEKIGFRTNDCKFKERVISLLFVLSALKRNAVPNVWNMAETCFESVNAQEDCDGGWLWIWEIL